MKVKIVSMIAALAIAFGVFGCGDDDDDGLLTLSAFVSDPVQVTLEENLGTLTFELGEEAPGDDVLLAFRNYLDDGTITLEVADSDTSVSYGISSGTQTTSNPDSAGEYRVTILGSSASIFFWNEFEGGHISSGGNYTASITILSNDYFTAEDISSSVVVSH